MKEKDLLLERLRVLTSKMDVPVFRRDSIFWLSKNLGVRNSDHPDFNEAIDIVKKLRRMGING
jgi:hypothetical protein